MNPLVAFLGKTIVAFGWGWGIGCFLRPDMPAAPLGQSLVKAFAAIHTIEIFLFWSRIKASGRPLPVAVIGVFVFGLFYGQTLPPLAETEKP